MTQELTPDQLQKAKELLDQLEAQKPALKPGIQSTETYFGAAYSLVILVNSLLSLSLPPWALGMLFAPVALHYLQRWGLKRDELRALAHVVATGLKGGK